MSGDFTRTIEFDNVKELLVKQNTDAELHGATVWCAGKSK